MIEETKIDILVLADGSQIDPNSGRLLVPGDSLVKEAEHDGSYLEWIDNPTGGVEFEPIVRTIADLPLPVPQIHTVALVYCYTMFGLERGNIARILQISEDDVHRIIQSNAYASLGDTITEQLRKVESDEVKSYLVAYSKRAARNQMVLAETANDEKVRHWANKDLLDRAGQTRKDLIDQQQRKQSAGLTIRIIEQKQEEMPLIDVTPTHL